MQDSMLHRELLFVDDVGEGFGQRQKLIEASEKKHYISLWCQYVTFISALSAVAVPENNEIISGAIISLAAISGIGFLIYETQYRMLQQQLQSATPSKKNDNLQCIVCTFIASFSFGLFVRGVDSWFAKDNMVRRFFDDNVSEVYRRKSRGLYCLIAEGIACEIGNLGFSNPVFSRATGLIDNAIVSAFALSLEKDASEQSSASDVVLSYFFNAVGGAVGGLFANCIFQRIEAAYNRPRPNSYIKHIMPIWGYSVRSCFMELIKILMSCSSESREDSLHLIVLNPIVGALCGAIFAFAGLAIFADIPFKWPVFSVIVLVPQFMLGILQDQWSAEAEQHLSRPNHFLIGGSLVLTYINAYFFVINQYTQSISQLLNRLSFFSHHRHKVTMSVLLMNIIGASIGMASKSLSVNDAFTLFLLEGALTFGSLVLTVEVKDPLVNSAGRVRPVRSDDEVDENGAALLGAPLGSGTPSC